MDGELVSRWFNGKQLPDELIKLAKRNAVMTQHPVCNAETPPPPPPLPPLQASRP